MKGPLHYQTSEYDCVPTTFLNAVTWLFHRESIPPIVIRHIFLYSMDTVGRTGRIGAGGTSSEAVRLLGQWLGQYRTPRFAVHTEYLEGDDVHLGRGSRIVTCLNAGGVALCNVHLRANEWHYVLALRAQREWLLCFDPYHRKALRNLAGRVRLPAARTGRSPNLAIRRDWLDAHSNHRRFCLGTKTNREALLIARRKR